MLHFLVDGWRLIFFINLPIGIVALWTTHHYLAETEKIAGKDFDYSGIVILTAGLLCLIYPLAQGRESGWPLWSILSIIFSLGIFTFFVYDQRNKAKKMGDPLIDMELFRNKNFSIGLIAVLFQFMMHTSFCSLVQYSCKQGYIYRHPIADYILLFLGILFTVSSVIASKLLPVYGKLLPQTGVMIITISFLLQICLFTAQVNDAVIFILIGMYGLGNGLVLPSLLSLALNDMPQKYAGSAAGVYSTFQQTASALGVCIIGGIFYNAAHTGIYSTDYIKAYRISAIANVLCLLLTMIMLVLLPKLKSQQPEVLAE